jgi:hypothetical protein
MSYRVRVYGQALLGWHDEDTLEQATQSAKSLLENDRCNLAEVVDNDTHKDVWSSASKSTDDRWARLRERVEARIREEESVVSDVKGVYDKAYAIVRLYQYQQVQQWIAEIEADNGE